MSFRAF